MLVAANFQEGGKPLKVYSLCGSNFKRNVIAKEKPL